MNQVFETIFARRSMRKFTSESVTAELLDMLLQAGMSAPSAVNSQPWEFVIVTDEAVLEKLRHALPFGKFHAPAAIVVCGNPVKARNPSGLMFWQQDCSAATENILLAATALGLGSCWVGIHPIPILPRLVRKALHMPPWVTPLCAIYLGHPQFSKSPKSKYDPAKIHYNTYRK